MDKQKNEDLAEELTGFLIKLNQGEDRSQLRKQADRLIESVSPRDFVQAEYNLKRGGISPSRIQQLSTLFILMGMAEKDRFDLRQHLPDYHILRKVMAEHEIFRCFIADLEEVADRIGHASHLSETSDDFMRLSHVAEHLNSLEEHVGREDDILFPALKERGWESLFCRIQSEHTYIQAAVDDLLKLVMVLGKMPFNNFKTKLMSTVRYLCPLLREHLFYEDYVLFPLAVLTLDDKKLWQRLREVCNEIGYCGVHL